MKDYQKIHIISKTFTACMSIWILFVLSSCESKERYYRPNLPEKLSSIGIIDIDDTTNYDSVFNPFAIRTSARFISFEKSNQSEYPVELNDSLRKFSFSISSSGNELLNYKSDSTIKNLIGFDIPSGIEFHPGEKYILSASEATTPEIYAECSVPEYPSVPVLISFVQERTTLANPTPCWGLTSAKSLVIDFTFENVRSSECFYAILLEGEGGNLSSTIFFNGKALLEFDVRDCNSPGFFAELSGFKMGQWTCQVPFASMIKVPVYAYFIEGSKIPENKCVIKISTQFADERALLEFIKTLQIRLLSIPKDLFKFEKSLYSYRQNSKDPFSEPVNLNGNIQGGNGVFAICRSRVLQINLIHWYLN
jgi:hypothetical protein